MVIKLYILTFLIIGLSMLGMAIGVLLSGRAIRGSCSGSNNRDNGCPSCTGQCTENEG